MKYAIILLTLALTLGNVDTAKAFTPQLGFASTINTSSARAKAMQASHSILVKKFDYNASVAAADNCTKYRRMRTAGIVLLSVGAASTVTGIAVASAAGIYYANNGHYPYGYLGGGGALISLGLVGVGLGTGLTIAGSVKHRKYCSGSSMNGNGVTITPSYTGLGGIACRF